MSEYIYSTGCLEAADLWVNNNMLPVAGTAVGIAVIEVPSVLSAFSVCLPLSVLISTV